MAHFIPCNESIDAEQFAQLYIDNIFKHHGLPANIVSDRDKLFTSNFWKAFCQATSIKSNLSSAYHPQTDGQTERTNQTLEQYLRVFCNYQQDNWAKLLSLAEFSYNNSVHSTTQQSPFYAVYNSHPRSDAVQIQSNTPSANEMIRSYTENVDVLKGYMIDAQREAELYYNKKKEPLEFKVGDLVLLSTKNLKTTRPSKKLSDKFIGPFKVIDKISSNAYRLKLPSSYRIHNVFHVSLLRLHFVNEFSEPVSHPDPILINEEEEFEVEEILDSKVDKRVLHKVKYLVKWKGYSSSENSYVTYSDLTHARDLIDAFHAKHPRKPKPIFS
jgi:hypothetical protein